MVDAGRQRAMCLTLLYPWGRERGTQQWYVTRAVDGTELASQLREEERDSDQVSSGCDVGTWEDVTDRLNVQIQVRAGC